MKLCNIWIFRLALALSKHGLKMPVLANTLFGPKFFSVNNLSNVTAAYLVFLWNTVLDDRFQTIAWFHTVVSRTTLSDKQSEHSFSLRRSKSGLCNLKLCYIREHAKTSLFLSECFCYQLCLLSSQCFAMIALLQTSQKNFSWINRIRSRHWANFKFWFLQPCMLKLLAALVYQEVFYQTLYDYYLVL